MPTEPPAPPIHPPRQPSLFPGEGPKVIPFDSFSSGRAAREHLARAKRQKQAAAASAAAAHASQQNLDFRPRAQRPPTVYEEAPVASTRVRLKASLLDAALCLLGAALAAAVFRLLAGAFAVTRQTGIFYAGAAAAMLIAYHLFWCLLGRETAGMSCFRLQLLTFDGSPPDWRLRLFRFSAAGLGLSAVGLGWFWALMDEEGLTWHDHMSKTFPTVQDPNPGSFRRR